MNILVAKGDHYWALRPRFFGGGFAGLTARLPVLLALVDRVRSLGPGLFGGGFEDIIKVEELLTIDERRRDR